MFELFYVTHYQCIDQCILATNNNAPNAKICRSFVYDYTQHSCRLYDHDGNQPPAIMHPAEGSDYYKRTAILNQCAGPITPMANSHSVRSSSNPNLHTLKMTSTGELPWRSRVHGSTLFEHFNEQSKEQHATEATVQESHATDYRHHADHFKQSPRTTSSRQHGNKVEEEDPKQLGMLHSLISLQLEDGNGGISSNEQNRMTNVEKNESGFDYQTSRNPRLVEPRKRITTPSPSSVSGSEWILEDKDALRARHSRVQADTAAAARSIHNAHPVESVTRSSSTTTSQTHGSRQSQCSTSIAYYVVIGNEIVVPISSNENDAIVIQGVEQSQCTRYCSANKGAGGEPIKCSSINYFPLTRKCELYSILAEPHGPGSLVENDDVIYSEKFCLPVESADCYEVEIFILYVQKKVIHGELDVVSANSITTCLRHCLQTDMCKSATFDSSNRRCHLHDADIGSSPSAMKDASAGWVTIENDCRMRAAHHNHKGSSEDHENAIGPREVQWTEWTDCQFKLRGQLVRVRTRQCESDCPDEGLQVERCY
ncbi:hypothetical protein Tcan_13653 [Toxocara canis]|uniref:Apple domain-containing protein n=1 Tax=Toxocara canis TaxID=6265 RepID=A0A0B2VS27_TOXCA|nr:hypothetical protein Tcan_13653 [Toxocara canis]